MRSPVIRYDRIQRRSGAIGRRRLLLTSIYLFAVYDPNAKAQTALPSGGSIVSGQATIGAPSGNALAITQNSSRAIINWDSFSVGQSGSVNFIQPNSASAILNRVTGSTTSTIAGQVTGNGQVYLVNPNGIAITPTGTVQVGGGFVASTLDIGNADFNNGNLNFTGNGASAGVSNAGAISSASGGFVGLIGGAVSNAGTINVPLGKVGLGSGEQATLNPTGDGFLQIAIPTNTQTSDGRSLIDVAGKIKAAGGSIELKAATAQQAVRDAVNVSGRLSARSVSGRSGNILLDGGDGGNVAVSGTLAATGGKRTKGGTIAVTGNNVTLASTAKLNASGTGGGNVLVGGDMRGSADPSAKLIQGFVRNAQTTIIQSGAFIKADGTNGAGGNVAVWSDKVTDFRGNISATGAGSGNGGMAEVSSHGVLNYQGTTDLSAANGKFGTLLLDPYNVTISNSSDSNISGSSPFTPSGDDSNLSVNTLQNALNSANVTVNTGSSGSQAGDITLATALSWSGSNSLTLTAARDVIINGSVSTSFGNAGLNLNAGRNVAVNSNLSAGFFSSLDVSMTAATGSVSINNATISTSGGNLSINAPASGDVYGVALSGANLNIGGGTGSITGTTSGSGTGLLFSGSSTLASSGSGSWTLSGSSDSGAGVNLSNASLSSSGLMSITGSSNSGSSVYLSGSTVSTSGDLSVTGTVSSYRGVDLLGSNSLINSGSGTLSIAGASSATNINNGGISLNVGSSLSTSGNVSLSGTSTANTPGVGLNDAAISVSSGNLSISGTSSSGVGVSFYANNTLNNSGAGTISLAGTSSSGNGIAFYNNATVSSSGNVTLQGTSPTNNQSTFGLVFEGNNTFTSNSGNVSITGIDSGNSGSSNFSGAGVGFSGTTAFTNSGSGTFSLTGNSNWGSGVQFTPGGGLTSSGKVSVTGSGSNWLGIYLQDTNNLTNSSGNLTLTGTSQVNSGIFISGATSFFTNNGSSLSFIGNSQSYRGIDFYDSSRMTFAGGVTLSGRATTGIGTNFERNAISISSGDLNISGTSTSGAGVRFGTPATTAFLNSGSGAVTVLGTSTSGIGTLFSPGNNVTTSNNTTISGVSNSNNGLYLDSNNTISASSGNLTLSGSSSSSVGLELRGTSSVANNGGGTLTLNASGGADLSAAVSSTGGPLVISGSGNINQSGGTITATNVQVSGTSGNFTLDTASNQISNLAANSASLALTDSSSLNVGTVLGTTGVTTTGNVSLVTSGDLMIPSGATISGANPVLAATGNFVNNSGSTAVTATSGRWLIYSNTPSSDTFGNLNSNNTAIWGATYASYPPASVTQTGSRYLFAFQPTLTFTSTNGSKTYGDDATSTVANNYSISGLQTGVANAYSGDTLSSVYSGTPDVTSAGSAPTAGVAGSPYSIDVAAGTLTSSANYLFAYQNTGRLTVMPASVDVTALGGSSGYGTSPANPGLSATGLKNNEDVSVLTGIANSFGITSSTAVGRYTTDVTGSISNPNYTVANRYTGTWDVTPLRGSVSDSPSTAPGISNVQGNSTQSSSNSSTALDGFDASGAVNAGNNNPAAAAARARSQAAASGNAANTGLPGSSALPDSMNAPVNMPFAETSPSLPRPASPLSSFASATPVAKTGCGEGVAGNADGSGASASGGSEGCTPPAANKEPGLVDFALAKLNRNALFNAIDREFSDMQGPTGTTTAAVTTAIAGTSFVVTAGIVGWLLRGGALLTALLSSMPLWREFDPLTVMTRSRRRDDDEDQPSSRVDRMFESAADYVTGGREV
jgi:filamentous hemagglutinin family protein